MSEDATMELPEPLVSVTQTGIFVEWHARGLNIEVRVRETGTYVLIEDRDGHVLTYSGSDDIAVGRALSALCVMMSRSDQPHPLDHLPHRIVPPASGLHVYAVPGWGDRRRGAGSDHGRSGG